MQVTARISNIVVTVHYILCLPIFILLLDLISFCHNNVNCRFVSITDCIVILVLVDPSMATDSKHKTAKEITKQISCHHDITSFSFHISIMIQK